MCRKHPGISSVSAAGQLKNDLITSCALPHKLLSHTSRCCAGRVAKLCMLMSELEGALILVRFLSRALSLIPGLSSRVRSLPAVPFSPFITHCEPPSGWPMAVSLAMCKYLSIYLSIYITPWVQSIVSPRTVLHALNVHKGVALLSPVHRTVVPSAPHRCLQCTALLSPV